MPDSVLGGSVPKDKKRRRDFIQKPEVQVVKMPTQLHRFDDFMRQGIEDLSSRSQAVQLGVKLPHDVRVFHGQPAVEQ